MFIVYDNFILNEKHQKGSFMSRNEHMQTKSIELTQNSNLKTA